MKKITRIFILIIVQVTIFFNLSLEGQRFPKPEFESGHSQPLVLKPEARALMWEYIDIFVLFLCLSLITWLVIKKRSRRGVIYMSIFSLVYFGFIREGCICSVGSVQNVTLALFHPSYVIPISAIAFFSLPLIFTLFFGRTFCAGVCPLGAIQDLVAIKPIEVSPWLQKTLGILPFVYLGFGILYAATASDFVICRYDPFIGIYRLDGSFLMFSLGGLLLLSGVFIARPYCRFLCPYGVLLNWASRFSKYHMTITPSTCIDCNLCEHSCPFGAIEKPMPSNIKVNRQNLVQRFVILAVIIPLLVFTGVWTGKQISDQLALVNPKVKMASEVLKAEANPDQTLTLNVESFLSSGRSKEELFAEAEDILGVFRKGSMWLGAFIALVIGMSLVSLSTFKYREGYEPNKGNCLSCARCMDFCPVGTDMELEFLDDKTKNQ